MAENLYDIARQVTDEVLGEGTYAEVNKGNPDPGVQAAIQRDKTKAIKQVIVWNHAIKCRKGKFGAQVAHASMAFITHKLSHATITVDLSEPAGNRTYKYADITLSASESAWLEGLFTKVICRVNSEEELLAIHQAALDAGLASHLITDAGLTEFNGIPTITCCALGPDLNERIDPITWNLDLL